MVNGIRANLRSGNIIMVIALSACVLGLIGVTVSQIPNLTRSRVKSQDVLRMRHSISGVLDYASEAFKNRWCLDATMAKATCPEQTGQLDRWVEPLPFNSEKMTISRRSYDSLVLSLPAGVPVPPADLQDCEVASLVCSRKIFRIQGAALRALAADHVLRRIFQRVNVELIDSVTLRAQRVGKDPRFVDTGTENYVEFSVDIALTGGGTVQRMLKNFSGNDPSGRLVAAYSPRELNTFALVTAGGIDLTGGETLPAPGQGFNLPLMGSSEPASGGLAFLSPVYVEGSVTMPSPTNEYSPVTFMDTVHLGFSAAALNVPRVSNLGSPEPYAPRSAGGFSDWLWAQSANRGFGGFMKGVQLESEADRGLQELFSRPVVIGAPDANPFVTYCIGRQKDLSDFTRTKGSKVAVRALGGPVAVAPNALKLTARFGWAQDMTSADFAELKSDTLDSGRILNHQKFFNNRFEAQEGVNVSLLPITSYRHFGTRLYTPREAMQEPGPIASIGLAGGSEGSYKSSNALGFFNFGGNEVTAFVIEPLPGYDTRRHEVYSVVVNPTTGLYPAGTDLLESEREIVRIEFKPGQSEQGDNTQKHLWDVSVTAKHLDRLFASQGGARAGVGAPGRLSISFQIRKGYEVGNRGDGVSSRSPSVDISPTSPVITYSFTGGASPTASLSVPSTWSYVNPSPAGYVVRAPDDTFDHVREESECFDKTGGVVKPARFDADFLPNIRSSWNFQGPLPDPDPTDANSKVAKYHLFSSRGDSKVLVRSTVQECVVKSTADVVAAMLVCDTFIIEPRTQPLTIVGTVIAGRGTIAKSAIAAGIRWLSFNHPDAVSVLRTFNIPSDTASVRFNAVPGCDINRDRPFWAVNGTAVQEIEKCAQDFFLKSADPMRWGTVDPDCGQLPGGGTVVSCKNRDRRLTKTVVSMESRP